MLLGIVIGGAVVGAIAVGGILIRGAGGTLIHRVWGRDRVGQAFLIGGDKSWERKSRDVMRKGKKGREEKLGGMEYGNDERSFTA